MKKYALILFFAFGTAVKLTAQRTSIEIDLGSSNSLKIPASSDLTTLKTVVLKNAFPNKKYAVTVDKIPLNTPDPLSMGGAPAGLSGSCTDLENEYKTVLAFAAKTDQPEKELKTKLTGLVKLRDESGCTDGTLLVKIKALLDATEQAVTLPGSVSLDKNSSYVIKVTSGSDNWTVTIQGETRGRWLLNYGFLFSPRKWEPQRYFLQTLGNDEFEIRRKKDVSNLDMRFSPMIFFSYFLDRRLNKDLNHSISGGIGYNTQSPVVSIGYNVMFNQNIGVSTGMVFYEQQKLDGRYTEGQILKENLDESKLYESTFFRPTLFFAINFRLGDNPFKKSDSGNQ